MSTWRPGAAGTSVAGDRRIADVVLTGMSRQFTAAYAPIGRPSIAPEKLLRALLLQALYTIRSERQLVDRIDFDLLFRWFVAPRHRRRRVGCVDFRKEPRGRFLEMDAAAQVLAGVVNHRDVRWQMGRDHFSIDVTLIDAWASMKSFKPKDDPGGDNPDAGRNAEHDFRGEKRSNETHASTTDPDTPAGRPGARHPDIRQNRAGRRRQRPIGILCHAPTTPR
jgi:transposase